MEAPDGAWGKGSAGAMLAKCSADTQPVDCTSTPATLTRLRPPATQRIGSVCCVLIGCAQATARPARAYSGTIGGCTPRGPTTRTGLFDSASASASAAAAAASASASASVSYARLTGESRVILRMRLAVLHEWVRKDVNDGPPPDDMWRE